MQGILSTYGAWNRWKGNLLGFHLSLVLKLSDKHRRSSHDFFKPEITHFFFLFSFLPVCFLLSLCHERTQGRQNSTTYNNNTQGTL